MTVPAEILESTADAELTPAERVSVASALGAHAQRPGALLPVLHAIQDALGYVPPGATGPIAVALNLSRAEVYGVITFYHDFRASPPGQTVVKVCRAESCQAMGGEALAGHLEKHHGCAPGQTRADGALTHLPVYCLGNCALSPAIMVGGEVFGRVTPARLDTILAAAEPKR